jgi:hypothetical protein
VIASKRAIEELAESVSLAAVVDVGHGGFFQPRSTPTGICAASRRLGESSMKR